MHIVLVLGFLSLVILPVRCNIETDGDTLTAFEKRLAEFRKDFEKDTDAFENSDIQHDSPQIGSQTADSDTGDNTGNEKQLSDIIKHSSDKTERCCSIGKLLADHGLKCEHNRFSRADRRVKLRLVNSTLSHLGIQINDDNRNTLYNPLRTCILRNAREIDKCCLLNANTKGGYNKKEHDLGMPSRRANDYNSYGSKHYRSRFESGEAMKGHSQFNKPPRGHGRRNYHGNGLHQGNYNWDRWADYRSYRARNRQRTARHRSYRSGLRDTTF